MICAFARLKDPDLADWMEANVAFPNSMVDRITPVTTEQDIERLADQFGVTDLWPVVCEPFSQWVLEDRFTQGRPPFEDAGVQLVDDVVPVRADEAAAAQRQPPGAVLPRLPRRPPLRPRGLPGPAVRADAGDLHGAGGQPDAAAGARESTSTPTVASCSNGSPIPRSATRSARLCAESSDRIPKWLVPVIRDNLRTGGAIDVSALVVASWARYAEGVDEQGRPIDVVDRRKDAVVAPRQGSARTRWRSCATPTCSGTSPTTGRFAAAYTRALAELHEHGAVATIQAVLEGRRQGR